jgi:SRSO17 transposase
VAYEGLRTLLVALEVFRPVLTEPSFRNLIVVFSGWVLTGGTHAVTQALVETAVPGREHHEKYHRFFSRGTWNPDELGHRLFDWITSLSPKGSPIRIVLDDTLATKKGEHVYGIGSHLDAVRSTKVVKVFAFGHVWVMLSVVVAVPFSSLPWALPVLFRLYRNTKECKEKGDTHSKKTELAHEMIETVAGWAGERRLWLSMDCAYCNATVMRDLPSSVVVFGSMRPDAVLTAAPVPAAPIGKKGRRKGGRPPVRGELLPKPEMLAKDERRPWKKCQATLYGKTKTVQYKELSAQWYRAWGAGLLRIVVVKVTTGRIALRVFFCTDLTLSIRQVLEGYGDRWSIEVCFRDLKQLLGFVDSSARKKAAVERTAPFVGFTYTTLVLWFMQGIHQTTLATPPLRPWYTHKRGLSFADVLRAAQRTLAPLDVLDPARSLNNLHELAALDARPSARPRKAAA